MPIQYPALKSINSTSSRFACLDGESLSKVFHLISRSLLQLVYLVKYSSSQVPNQHLKISRISLQYRISPLPPHYGPRPLHAASDLHRRASRPRTRALVRARIHRNRKGISRRRMHLLPLLAPSHFQDPSVSSRRARLQVGLEERRGTVRR